MIVKELKDYILKIKIKNIQRDLDLIKETYTDIQNMSKIKSVALDLCYQEIAQRTHDSKELVRERVLDRAIEQFNVYGTDKPSELQKTIDRLGE